ncbi:MAG: polysaccharide deacetylase family protein [Pirellulales bacterium]|nr:polysaccharide deacetylase family protein [Pirellulales bacterium]
MEIKSQAKKFLVNSGMPRALSRLRRPSVVVLRYHSVMERPADHKSYAGDIVHATSTFKHQIAYLSKSCLPISIQEVSAMVQYGKALPRRAGVVTFDDGYADNLHNAAPILEKFGIRAIVYVTVAWTLDRQVPMVLQAAQRVFAYPLLPLAAWYGRECSGFEPAEPRTAPPGLSVRISRMREALRGCPAARASGDRETSPDGTAGRATHRSPFAA